MACFPHHAGQHADYHSCMLLGGSHESYTLLTTLGVYRPSHHEPTSSTRGLSQGSRILKSVLRDNLKSTPVAPSPTSAGYCVCVCKLWWNLAVSGPQVLSTMVPSCTWSSRPVPWVSYPKYSRLVPWVPYPKYSCSIPWVSYPKYSCSVPCVLVP
jgi:hypothetical protein